MRMPQNVSRWIAVVAAGVVAAQAINTQTVRWREQMAALRQSIQLSYTPVPRAGGAIAVTDRLVIGFADGVSPAASRAIGTRHGLRLLRENPALGTAVMSVSHGGARSAADAARAVAAAEAATVEFVEADVELSPSAAPNDPSFGSQWHQRMVGSASAWDVTAGAGVTVAVLDTGFDADHPDLPLDLAAAWNFFSNNGDVRDTIGHGTAVLGTLAAAANNGIDAAGVAPAVTVLPLRVGDVVGYTTYATLADAIAYAADRGARVVNASYEACASRSIARAARYLEERGGVLVLAAGNRASPSPCRPNDAIIEVSATTEHDAAAGWSNYGNNVDVSAPGQAILTTMMNGGLNWYSGTSYAAPIASAALALIWSANPSLSPADARQVLFDSVQDLGAPGFDHYYGWGRVDAAQAVSAARAFVSGAGGGGGQGKGNLGGKGQKR